MEAKFDEEEVTCMALVRWTSPWQFAREIEREFDALAQRMFSPGLQPLGTAETAGRLGWSPAVDVLTRGDDLVVRAELPGVDPEKDVEISYHDGVLTLRGERRQEQRTEGERYFRLETTYGSFERSIPLPEGVNADTITASHKDGVLEIVVPGGARQVSGAKRIPVQAVAPRLSAAEPADGTPAEPTG
jgi:HSP20 family protein